MREFPIRELVAGVVAIGCLVLIGMGFDGEVKALLGVIVGYYFGYRIKRS